MAIVMNMSSYAIEEDSTSSDAARHSGWNPPLELATQQHLNALTNHTRLPVGLLTADAEIFLQKMYAYRC